MNGAEQFEPLPGELAADQYSNPGGQIVTPGGGAGGPAFLGSRRGGGTHSGVTPSLGFLTGAAESGSWRTDAGPAMEHLSAGSRPLNPLDPAGSLDHSPAGPVGGSAPLAGFGGGTVGVHPLGPTPSLGFVAAPQEPGEEGIPGLLDGVDPRGPNGEIPDPPAGVDPGEWWWYIWQHFADEIYDAFMKMWSGPSIIGFNSAGFMSELANMFAVHAGCAAVSDRRDDAQSTWWFIYNMYTEMGVPAPLAIGFADAGATFLKNLIMSLPKRAASVVSLQLQTRAWGGAPATEPQPGGAALGESNWLDRLLAEKASQYAVYVQNHQSRVWSMLRLMRHGLPPGPMPRLCPMQPCSFSSAERAEWAKCVREAEAEWWAAYLHYSELGQREELPSAEEAAYWRYLWEVLLKHDDPEVSGY